jgi:hypothetical protein
VQPDRGLADAACLQDALDDLQLVKFHGPSSAIVIVYNNGVINR